MVAKFAALCLLSAGGLLPVASAQIMTGSMAGTIQDTSGAGVGDAALTLVQDATGALRRSASEADGTFFFSGIDGGEYTLKIEKPGFKTLEKRGIILSTGDRISVGALVLELGAVSETISVTAEAAVVQIASSERSDVITGKQIEDTLVQGRNIVDLVQFVPGVYMENTQTDLSGSFNFYVQGSRSTTNNISIDGVMSTDLGSAGQTKAVVSMGAVGEVKVLVSNYQAEYGRMPGSNIEIVTKSGTRRFHGQGEYFLRREWLNANSFFNNRNSLPRPLARYNTLTYNMSGPVFIPGHFNRQRQKLFFFWNQEYWPSRATVNGDVTVPTALERSGDFSQSVNLANNPIQVRDPFNGNLQFPGNVIPKSRIDPNGQALLNVFPLPNFTDRSVSAGNYNYVFASPLDDKKVALTAKIDYNIDSSNVLTGSISYYTNPQTGANSAGNNSNWPQFYWKMTNHPTTASIRYTHIFSPTLINEFQVGGVTQPVDTTFRPDALQRNQRDTAGFRAGQIFPAANPLGVIPNATFGGVTGAAKLSIEARFPRYNRYQVLSLSDNVTWTRGAHIFKAGYYFEYFHRIQKGSTGSLAFNGSFDFGNNANNPLTTNYAYGNAILGTFNTYTETSSSLWMRVSTANNQAFVQDTWRPFRRFTLDYGVRFYRIAPIVERDNQMDAFVQSRYDPARAMQLIRPTLVSGKRAGINPVTGQTYPEVAVGAIAPGVGAAYNGMLLATTNPDHPRGMVNGSGIKPAPRIGFAYDLFGDGSTAVRGGFGLAYSGYATELFSGYFVRQPPLIQVPILYYGQISQMLGSQGFTFPSSNTYAADARGTVPSVMNFSLSVQRRFWHGTILDMGYAGSLGRHLQWMRNINAVPLGANFLAENRDPTNAGRPLPANFLRPIPGYGPINIIEMAGSSNYHSLQISARRRFARRLQFGAAWTWSKSMDFNDTDQSSVATLVPLRAWNYGPASFDRTHIVKVNYLYELPSMPTRNPVLGGVFNGWQLSGIASFISGQPMGVGFNTTAANDITGSPDLSPRPVITDSAVLPKDRRTFDRYFDTSVFAMPAVGTVGNAAKSVFRGPGVNNWDVALAKTFRLTERAQFRFRFEAFNAFNHTQFSNVNANAQFNSATGAQTNAAFGRITGARKARTVQLAGRISF